MNLLFSQTFCDRQKQWFAFSKIGFCAGTKVFEEALNAVKFLGWLKKFGLAKNNLGPVKGEGIRFLSRLLVIYNPELCPFTDECSIFIS